MQSDNNASSFDIMKLLKAIRRNILYIILAALICGMAAFMYTKLFVKPMYQATTTVIIQTRQEKNGNVTVDQINSASMLANTYMEIVTSRTVLNTVISDLGLKMSYEQLKSSISSDMPEENMVLTIKVKNGSTDEAKRILNKIMSVTNDVLKEKEMVGTYTGLDTVHAGSNPVSPNKLRNARMAALAAAVIYVGIIALTIIFNNSYRNDEELKSDLGISVLGVIPLVNDIKTRKSTK